MLTTTIERWHEIDAGHRVHLHESKCRHVHGHRYRVTVRVSAPTLDEVGRVIDFSVLKDMLFNWLDLNWDHRLLLWEEDPLLRTFAESAESYGVVAVPFNPTAENMAAHLMSLFASYLRKRDAALTLVAVTVRETGKCSATVSA